MKAKAKTVPEYPMVVETFRRPRYWVQQAVTKEPSCFNNIVDVLKYRITAELIEEPIEVIQQRILKLWRECDSWHHTQSLESAAERYGLELNRDEHGIDRKKQTGGV